ncbi:MAG: ATP synthase subunit I [Dongiaceae bacterium]
MNGEDLTLTLLAAAAAAAAGLGIGLAYFRLMRWTVASVTARQGWLLPVTLTVARVACAVAVFAVLAKLGAIPLLVAFAGFLAARKISVGAARGAA